MILSSSDILRILGADAIVRQEAKLAVVEGRPGLGTDDTVYIYVEKYPTVEDFEATWKIWVQDNSGMGKYVLDAMTSLLPNFDFNGQYYTTTDFASERTVVKSQEEIDREEFQDRFSGLQKGLEDRLSTVRDGRDGKDGRDGLDGRHGVDGKDGKDGRDGRDIEATETELFDLKDVEQSPIPLEKGQVLTWDGSRWTNLYTRVSSSVGGGGSYDTGWDSNNGGGNVAGVTSIIAGDGIAIDQATGDVTITNTGGTGGLSDGVEEAPQDGLFYVRSDKKWIELESALASLGYVKAGDLDGGDFTTGTSNGNSGTVDGGNFA